MLALQKLKNCLPIDNFYVLSIIKMTMVQEEKQQFEDEINLADYVRVLLKRKKLILGLFFGAAIAAGV